MTAAPSNPHASPGAQNERVAELERVLAKVKAKAGSLGNPDASAEMWALADELKAELSRLSNEQPKGGDGRPQLRETMWAEMKPDCYGGETCDKIVPRWNVYADGDKQDDTIHEPLQLDPRTFPPGTKVIVQEPTCPKCGDVREPLFPQPETGPLYAGPCDCGFDWDAWVLEQYA